MPNDQNSLSPSQIADEAIRRFNKRITNEIFMIIQNDRDLMKHYLKAVHKDGLDTVNRTIGRKVKDSYGLKNIEDREDNPSCTLISSHQKFE